MQLGGCHHQFHCGLLTWPCHHAALRAGKPVMFRSKLVRKQGTSSSEQQQQDKEDEELVAFLAKDML
jgi:hypothetical protein